MLLAPDTHNRSSCNDIHRGMYIPSLSVSTCLINLPSSKLYSNIHLYIVYNIVCYHYKTAITDPPVMIYTVACISPPCL